MKGAEASGSPVSCLIIPDLTSIKSTECKTSILHYGLILRALTTSILPEVAAEKEDVNERIKAKDNG